MTVRPSDLDWALHRIEAAEESLFAESGGPYMYALRDAAGALRKAKLCLGSLGRERSGTVRTVRELRNHPHLLGDGSDDVRDRLGELQTTLERCGTVRTGREPVNDTA